MNLSCERMAVDAAGRVDLLDLDLRRRERGRVERRHVLGQVDRRTDHDRRAGAFLPCACRCARPGACRARPAPGRRRARPQRLFRASSSPPRVAWIQNAGGRDRTCTPSLPACHAAVSASRPRRASSAAGSPRASRVVRSRTCRCRRRSRGRTRPSPAGLVERGEDRRQVGDAVARQHAVGPAARGSRARRRRGRRRSGRALARCRPRSVGLFQRCQTSNWRPSAASPPASSISVDRLRDRGRDRPFSAPSAW